MKNKEDLYKIKKKERVWCWSRTLEKYISGYITSIGQDGEDRWGDISYWAYLDNNQSIKYYDILTKQEYITRVKLEIRKINLEVGTIMAELEEKHTKKGRLEDLILELEND